MGAVEVRMVQTRIVRITGLGREIIAWASRIDANAYKAQHAWPIVHRRLFGGGWTRVSGRTFESDGSVCSKLDNDI